MKLKNSIIPLYFLSFIFSIQYALVVYVNSSFLGSVAGEKNIGIIFTFASLLSILFLLEIPHLLNRFGNYKTTILLILCNILSLLTLGLATSKLLIILAFFLYTISNYSLIFARDVFIESFGPEGATGKTRGLFLTIINLAWVFAPSISGFVVTSSYTKIYLLAAIFTVPSLFFIFPYLKNFADPIYRRISIHSTFRKIWSDVNLKKIYASEFLLRFFYSWMIIYMPIYLHQYLFFSWKEIGVMFTVMLIPFVLLDYPLGLLSDKIGEKKIMSLGFLIMSLATISIFFIKIHSVFFWAMLLFTTRVGAATVEVMNESYFFKKIRASDASLISFFRNLFPASFIISPAIASLLLLFLSHEYLFLILGLTLFSGIYFSLTLREIIHS